MRTHFAVILAGMCLIATAPAAGADPDDAAVNGTFTAVSDGV